MTNPMQQPYQTPEPAAPQVPQVPQSDSTYYATDPSGAGAYDPNQGYYTDPNQAYQQAGVQNNFNQTQTQGQMPAYVPPKKKSLNGFAIAGLIVGLVALWGALWPLHEFVNGFGVIGLALSAVGMAWTGLEDEGGERTRTQKIARILAIAGIVISILAIVLTVLDGFFDFDGSNNLQIW